MCMHAHTHTHTHTHTSCKHTLPLLKQQANCSVLLFCAYIHRHQSKTELEKESVSGLCILCLWQTKSVVQGQMEQSKIQTQKGSNENLLISTRSKACLNCRMCGLFCRFDTFLTSTSGSWWGSGVIWKACKWQDDMRLPLRSLSVIWFFGTWERPSCLCVCASLLIYCLV